MSISKAVIMGKVVRNPEKRFTSNDVPITYFTIDISRSDSTGKPQEPVLLRVLARGKNLAELVANTVKKDTIVIVEGRLQTNTVKDATGIEKKIMELDARAVEIVNEAISSPANYQENVELPDIQDSNTNDNTDDLIGEDEIPF